MTLRFVVEGKPQPKQRPRVNTYTRRAYTPQKTHDAEKRIAWEYQRQCKGYMFGEDEYLILTVIAYMPIPKSKTKKEQAEMREGKRLPANKPDADNLLKLVADSINGIAYRDDKQIVEMHSVKRYSDHPRTDVIIKSYEREE